MQQKYCYEAVLTVHKEYRGIHYKMSYAKNEQKEMKQSFNPAMKMNWHYPSHLAAWNALQNLILLN